MPSLFPRDRLFLPAFREDESLYSWCAYYHALSSNPTSRQTCLQLFGHRDAGLKHDFPICIDTLIERTEGQLGIRNQIIFNRTPVGALPRFIESSRLQSICDLMGSGPLHHVARMLKIHAIHQGSFSPLKACPRCLSECLSTSHSSTWRIEHQLPGVYFCQEHGDLLHVVSAAGYHRARYEFLLPHMLSPHEWHAMPALSKEAMQRLHTLSTWSLAFRVVSGDSYIPFDPSVLRDTLYFRAKDRGWVGIDGSLEFKKIRLAIGAAQEELFAVPGLEFLSFSRREDGGYIGTLLRLHNGSYTHHPLMYAALLSFLFDTVEEFHDRYNRASEIPRDARRNLLTNERRSLSKRLSELVGKQGFSVNQAAKEVGIHPSRAIAYLNEKGVEYERRPHIVGTPLESKLIERLELGDEPSTVSSQMNVRRGYIKDYLASNPELRHRHIKALFERRREAYRAKFKLILTENPSLPIKRIRRETNSGFEWLYRHDKDWLIEILPGCQRPAYRIHSKIGIKDPVHDRRNGATT